MLNTAVSHYVLSLHAYLTFLCLIISFSYIFLCIFCYFYYSTNSDLTHLWEVVDVAKERLVNSNSTCSSPGDTSSGGYGGHLSTGRKTQRIVKASSTAPVITHIERPRSAHNEAEKAKEGSGVAFLGIEDAFDKAISLPNSPITKEQPLHDAMEIKKTHETKKAQRRHHTHHLFDGILHTISGGERSEDVKSKDPETSNYSPQDIDRSRWQQNKDTDASASPSGTPVGLIRRWSETTSQNKQIKVRNEIKSR